MASLSNVNWIPVDLLAEILLELGFHHIEDRGHSRVWSICQDNTVTAARVSHILKLKPEEWATFLPYVSSALNASRLSTKALGVISLEEWVGRVQASAEACVADDVEAMLEINPEAKILVFFEGLVKRQITIRCSANDEVEFKI